MPSKQRPSFLKRQKEMARLQKAREKVAKRHAKKQTRGGEGPPIEGVDPEVAAQEPTGLEPAESAAPESAPVPAPAPTGEA